MGWRRFIPGKRKNRREDQVIQAIPISDAGPLLHEDDTDPETSLQYHTQQQHGNALMEPNPNLNIDYGRFQEGVAHPPGMPPPPAHDTAVPATQHYGERAITHLDYDGVQAPGSENFNPTYPSSVSRSHSRHRRGSRPSSKAPDITVHPPSIMSGGGHMRSGSPDPLPIPPPQHKNENGYRADRSLYHEPERHRSQRRRDQDRSRGYAPHGEPRVSTDFPGEQRLIARNPDSLEHPDFQFSKCTGRKKALCIGINYTGQNSQLDGCVSDAKNIHRFLIDRLGFRSRDIIRLTDDARDSRNLPTRSNILNAMRWLVRDAHKHDSLFIHYSGHGSRVQDQNGDEVDGYDEVIFPQDYAHTGTIIDDDLHETLIRPLPPGCRLTAVFDSCHSGSILDIPFPYHSDGRVKKSSIKPQFIAQKSSPAEVICWSGSTDAGTAADVHEGGGIAVGAMSYAFLSALSNNKSRLTFEDLLRDLRRATRKYHQKPQLSASHLIDLNRQFLI